MLGYWLRSVSDLFRRFAEISFINIFISLFPAAFVLLTPDVIPARSLFILSIVVLLIMCLFNGIMARRHFFEIDKEVRKYLRINISAFLMFALIAVPFYMYFYSTDNVNALIWAFFPAGIFSYFGVTKLPVVIIYTLPMLVTIAFAPLFNYKFNLKKID